MFLQSLLGNYQADKPMSQFLVVDLFSIIKGLVQFIVKPGMLREATGPKLFMIDLDSKETFVTYSKVEIGFETKL